jgi:hypothetical protein
MEHTKQKKAILERKGKCLSFILKEMAVLCCDDDLAVA